MRRFNLQPSMKTSRGVFYPIGWMLLMFPREHDARHSATVLEDNGVPEQDVVLVTPEDVQREIMATVRSDGWLRSTGTEADTVRRLNEFARQGHYGLMILAPREQHSRYLLELLEGAKISYGRKYRILDVEEFVA